MIYRPVKRKQSQETQIGNALVRGETITPLDALKRFGAFRLSAIIFNLRKKGHNIITEKVEGKNNKYASYRIASK